LPTSSKLAIRSEGLGKRYKIGPSSGGTPFAYRSLREDAAKGIAGLLRRKPAEEAERWFWALKDVSFEIAIGERVGIIGRNGAGKSTMLKVLSRITSPTEGRAEVRGRVGSLLEVGTGFHPELTGRDNIFLSGAILGMHRSVIKAQLDEIIEFAGVSRFIDTPVKRYSSGMYLRLAFSVAAHLEPDILLVDEVLAVGDADFQKKCLGRMEDIGSSGRTVLFVSHSIPAILRLCDRVLLLDGGSLVADGKAQDVIGQYMHCGLGSSAERHWTSADDAPGDEVVRLKSVRVWVDGETTEEVDIRRPVDVEVQYWHVADQSEHRPSANLYFYNEDGILLFLTGDSANVEWRKAERRSGVVTATCRIPANFFAEGRIFVHTCISSINPVVVHLMERDTVSFQVVDRSSGDGVRGEWVGEFPGVLRPMLDWDVRIEPGVGTLKALDTRAGA